MALASIVVVPLLWPYLRSANASIASRNISASTHWVGGQFVAGATGTISEIWFATGTVASPVLDLEAAITALDANGYPLGADVAVSSTVASNPTANTIYTLTISASVTAGNWYGIIVRVKSGTYSSGSANVRSEYQGDWALGGSFPKNYPVNSYNLGADTKGASWSLIMPKYTSLGWVACPGISVGHVGSNANASTGSASGNVQGNKFTLNARAKVYGYLGVLETDNTCNCEIYAGSDNTAVTGSSVAVTTAYRNTVSEGGTVVPLSTPLTLEPGTYRVGLRNTSAAANFVRGVNAGLPNAGVQEMYGAGLGNVMHSSYASGAWTDDTVGILSISPIISAVDDGRSYSYPSRRNILTRM